MADIPFFAPRTSLTKGPDYSAKKDALSIFRKEKQTPSEADYKPAPVDSKKRCHECKNYENYGKPESSCARVIGVVKAEGTCDLWSQRDYSQTGTETSITLEVHHGR